MASGRLLVEILSIGDELLMGQTVNTNAAWMGRLLESEGWRVQRCTTVSDEESVILSALAEAEARSELVLITGGLGPTRDDITKHALCRHFGMELVRHPAIEDRIVSWFERRGREVLQVNRDQALLPAACTPLENLLGTASGMWFDRPDGVTVSMPGVPYEMEYIMENGVLPRMKERLKAGGRMPARAHLSLLTMGTGESQLARTIEDLESSFSAQGIGLAYLPSPGSVRMRLTAEGEGVSLLPSAHRSVMERLADWVVNGDGAPVEQSLADALIAAGRSLAVAESCTGGGLGAALVARSGASAYFRGGVQAYSNEAKAGMLGVDPGLIAQHGAVSDAVARAMAEGARRRFGADFALSVTGIAGPEGGSEAKPVGTVFMACAGPAGTRCVLHRFGRDRSRNIDMAIRSACRLALDEVRGEGGETKRRMGVADSL